LKILSRRIWISFVLLLLVLYVLVHVYGWINENSMLFIGADLDKQEFQNILDKSINQTLSRTVVTSGTTFLTVFALFILGGEVISDFAFTMIIGVIVGTYSSIYQSCPLLHFWNKIFKPKRGMGK